MDQYQGGQQSGGQGGGRPAVLADVSETQVAELERQHLEQDRSAWNTLTDSYGWTSDQADEVWAWFGAHPNLWQGSASGDASGSQYGGSDDSAGGSYGDPSGGSSDESSGGYGGSSDESGGSSGSYGGSSGGSHGGGGTV